MNSLQISKHLLFLILLNWFVTTQQNYYKKIIHNTDTEAKCLDGSPGALYLHQGSEKDKFLIFFIGGGFCGQSTLSDTLESCYARSKDMFGSSTLWPNTLNDKTGTEGFLSLNQSNYKNWTKILFAYCDGSLHQGDNANPIQFKDTKLYFRGARIVRSHFKWLINNYSLDKANKILLAGGSAGALGAFLWGNYLQKNVNDPNAVYVVPDSGIFLEAVTYQTKIPLISLQISNLMKLAHVSQKSPIEECNKQYLGQQWRCLFISNASPYLTGKYLFINSEYDEWAIQNILKIGCLTDAKYGGDSLANCSSDEMRAIEDYRSRYLSLINQKIKTKLRGIWSIACANHVYASKNDFYDVDAERIPGKVGKTVKDAIEQFVLNEQINWITDFEGWPKNQMCAY